MWRDIAAGYVMGELMLGGIAVACALVIFALAAIMEKVRGRQSWQGKRKRN